MKKVFLKVAAALVSTQMALACAGTIRSSANTLVKPIAGQSLGYVADVKKNGSTLNFNLCFSGIDNCAGLVFRVFYDSSKLRVLESDIDADPSNKAVSVISNTNNNGIVSISILRRPEHTGNISIAIPFRIKSGNSDSFEFSTEIFGYNTHSGYSYEVTGEKVEEISVAPTAHFVGDANMSDSISIADASAVLNVMTYTNQNKSATDTRDYYTSVNNYNSERVKNAKLIDASGLPKYNCGIALDVDNNGRIDINDADAILYYDSCRSINAPLPDNGVATTRYAVCYH